MSTWRNQVRDNPIEKSAELWKGTSQKKKNQWLINTWKRTLPSNQGNLSKNHTEKLLYIHKAGKNEKVSQYQVLVRMWNNKNSTCW